MTTLETPRLTLRQPCGDDLPAYLAYCTSQRTHFTGGPYSKAVAFDKLAAMIGHWHIRQFGRLIMCDRVTRHPFGHVGAFQLDDSAPAEMTWTLWGGADEGLELAREAARAYLDDVARQGRFQTLIARILPQNHRSHNLARRLGAVLVADAPSSEWFPQSQTYRFDFAR
jgi:RimJ/RimL family protein N-acetyltransferase